MEVDWNTLSAQPNGIITDEFIQQFNKSINFNILIKHYFFSSILINLFFPKINFKYLIRNQFIDEQILRNYSSCFDSEVWGVLPHYQNLSSEFLKDYQERLKIKDKSLMCYDLVARNNTLTFEKLNIDDFQGTCYEKTKVNQFKKVDLYTFNWTGYIKNVNISEIQLRKLTKYFDNTEWAILPKYFNLSNHFKEEFAYKLENFNGFLNKTCYPNISCKLFSNIFIVLLFQIFLL